MKSADIWAKEFAFHWDLGDDIRTSLAVWIEKVQEDAKPGPVIDLLPGYEKLVFWIKSNRGTDSMEVVQLPKKMSEPDRRNAVEEWCENFGAWDHSDNVVNYGWFHYRGKKPLGTQLQQGERDRLHRARKIREEKLARKKAKKGTSHGNVHS